MSRTRLRDTVAICTRGLAASRYDLAVANDFEVLRNRLRDFADVRGWGKSHSPRNLALALAGEVGELSAELQWVPDEQVDTHLHDPAARARVADEVADVLIYLIQFADACGIDPLRASNAKIDRNEVRFPPRRR
jgi:NTP pyrophosphatase (non-canonical NTP hydrolase)